MTVIEPICLYLSAVMFLGVAALTGYKIFYGGVVELREDL